jgi:hypothetical protein
LILAFLLAAYEAGTDTFIRRRENPDTGRYFGYVAVNGYQLSDVDSSSSAAPGHSASS